MNNNGLTILHVEDDNNDILLLQRALKKTGSNATIKAVMDGDKAVAYFTGSNEFGDRERYPLPQVVLLDLKMPRKSGLEVLGWIRSQPELKRVVVIVFTSSRHDEDINRAYDLGANSYLVKPVGFDALQTMIQNILHYWGELNIMSTR